MNKLLKATVFFSALLVIGCKKDTPIAPQGNLIKNPFFESKGNPSFDYWNGSNCFFSKDVPPSGGNWSLDLQPGWIPEEGYAETSVTGLSGNLTFKFTCYAKTIHGGYGPISYVSLRLKNQNGTTFELAKVDCGNYSSWTPVAITVTTPIQPTDELIVHLSATSTEVVGWDVLFDDVYLQQE